MWFPSCARHCGLATLLVTAISSGSLAQGNAPIVMKLSTATLNDVQHEWMKRFAVAIGKNANGRIKPELYPAGQLGGNPSQIEALQLGSIQAWLAPPEFLVGLDSRFEILSAPGLFRSDQNAISVLSDPEFSKAFLALGANKGMIGASLFFNGPGSFAMRTPMRRLADVKGKKIRVLASAFQREQAVRLGATGVPMGLGDVLPALQQGTIDGALSEVGVFSAFHFYDVTKYLTETRHFYVFGVSMLSKRWLDTLPPDLQGIVLATSKQVGEEVKGWDLNFQDQQRKVWVEKGGEIITLPDEEQKELMQKMRPIGEDIVKSQPQLQTLWDSLVRAASRNP
jgi:TRAP-type C4-dicarboxylate transport system substrate-binding protein